MKRSEELALCVCAVRWDMKVSAEKFADLLEDFEKAVRKDESEKIMDGYNQLQKRYINLLKLLNKFNDELKEILEESEMKCVNCKLQVKKVEHNRYECKCSVWWTHRTKPSCWVEESESEEK